MEKREVNLMKESGNGKSFTVIEKKRKRLTIAVCNFEI